MNNSYTGVVGQTPGDGVSDPDPIAIGLLRLQQRFDALDRLYNEEIGALCQELAQLKADYVRRFQSSESRPSKGTRTKRPRGLASHTPTGP